MGQMYSPLRLEAVTAARRPRRKYSGRPARQRTVRVCAVPPAACEACDAALIGTKGCGRSIDGLALTGSACSTTDAWATPVGSELRVGEAVADRALEAADLVGADGA